MSTVRKGTVQLLVGAISFLMVAGLLLGLYSYLDFQRLKQQKAYPSPEDAFLDTLSGAKVTVESSRRCSVIIAGQETLPLDDLWFVTAYYSVNGDSRPAGTLFFRIDEGWVRVSETSPTPLVICTARKVGQELAIWSDR